VGLTKTRAVGRTIVPLNNAQKPQSKQRHGQEEHGNPLRPPGQILGRIKGICHRLFDWLPLGFSTSVGRFENAARMKVWAGGNGKDDFWE
jgi:hypothetical protein